MRTAKLLLIAPMALALSSAPAEAGSFAPRAQATTARYGKAVKDLYKLTLTETVAKGHTLDTVGKRLPGQLWAGFNYAAAALSIGTGVPVLPAISVAIGVNAEAPVASRVGWKEGDVAQPRRFGALGRGLTHAGVAVDTGFLALAYGVAKGASKLPVVGKRIAKNIGPIPANFPAAVDEMKASAR